MFGTIRRHSKWLWLIIIAITIISFVVFFSPDAKFRNGGGALDLGTINGQPIKREQYLDALREVSLAYRFTYRSWPGRDDMSRLGFDIKRQTYQRLILIEKLKELNIQVGDDAVARHITRIFQDQPGSGFSQRVYDEFVKKGLPEAGSELGLTERDLIRFFRNELAIMHLSSVAGMSGKLITPRAAEAFYQRENEQFAASALFFNTSNYLATVKVMPAAVNEFFTNQISRYIIPQRAQVSYVRFASSNYLAGADQFLAKDLNFEKTLDNIYQQRGASSFKDANDKQLPMDAAKAKLKEEIRQDIALRMARTNANEVANELFKVQPSTVTNFFRLVAERKLAVKETEPFTEFDGPKDLAVGSSFSRAAFSLTPEEPVASPVAGTDGVYLMALKARLDSEKPSLESVRQKVTEDYRRMQADDAARQTAMDFLKIATNGLVQGRSFDDLCKQAKLSPVALPLFARSTRVLPEVEEKISLDTLVRLADETPLGGVSPLVPTREGGVILHLKARLPVPAEKMRESITAFTDELRSSRQGFAFNEWFRKEAERVGMTMGQGR